ncbi:hypothetical protein DRW07_17240 [Alteromonas sediminis]|uniref:Thiamin/hydroxymethyl pyrimidine-binding YkoF putative domain-containing protein n=1 Tax=Alteromonas sediminis TaxID=2259342 RepID=A0A3N5XX48_9ALTE|nr:YkoF family thiamine/hydroxymethylpyrimidine-binding protein [Alteromonas sediminis]RPJ65060.1 hypothetical protein DRW07_17240 [Alteromonas sediminis]
MQVMVEISLYPLAEQFVEPIQSFIDRLNGYSEIDVQTNQTSTHVTGDYGKVLSVLAEEMQRTHESVGQAIFVAKFLNFDAMQARAENN